MADQAALQDLLKRVRDLCMSLLSVNFEFNPKKLAHIFRARRRNDDYQRKFATNMTCEEVAAENYVGFNKCTY
jgi:hypothetical protein